MFSRAAVAFASLVAFGAAVGADSLRTSAASPPVRPYTAPPVFASGRAPAARASGCAAQPETVSGKTTSLTLKVERARTTIFNPATGKSDEVALRTYNGCIVGPTISMDPGGRLEILLDNALPPNSGCMSMDPVQGCFNNTTNLHTHGFHVSPSGHADNVLVTVEPGAKRPTVIDLPADHPAGTFWYHAHAHTSTAVQVTSGMEGVLIVRGNRKYVSPDHPADVDTILHDASGTPFPDRLFMFQQISYACFTDNTYTTIITSDGKPTSPWVCPPNHVGVVENFDKQLFGDQAWKNSGRFTTVNGVVQPTLQATAGRIERWRLVHGGINDSIELKIVKATAPAATLQELRGTPKQQLAGVNADCNGATVPQFEIAVDGLTRRRIQEIRPAAGDPPVNVLQPGYRSDVLVAFPSPGTYCVLDDVAKDVTDISTERSGLPRTRRLLATVEVSGGTTVTPDLRYVTQQLLDANKELDGDVRAALAKGEIAAWSPFRHDLTIPDAQPPITADSTCPNIPPATQNGPLKCIAFMRKDRINNKPYKHGSPTSLPEPLFRGTVGTTDMWIVSGAEHIYHIHVNPFQIYDIQYKLAPNKYESIYDQNGRCKDKVGGVDVERQYCGQQKVFRDTLMIRENYRALLLSRYDDFDGEFVMHCHILDHEDKGMMAEVHLMKKKETAAR